MAITQAERADLIAAARMDAAEEMCAGVPEKSDLLVKLADALEVVKGDGLRAALIDVFERTHAAEPGPLDGITPCDLHLQWSSFMADRVLQDPGFLEALADEGDLSDRTAATQQMDDRENSAAISKVAKDAYNWHDSEYSHQGDAFRDGFEIGVAYALDYAKLNPDNVTLQVRPLPGCSFPNPYLKGSAADA